EGGIDLDGLGEGLEVVAVADDQELDIECIQGRGELVDDVVGTFGRRRALFAGGLVQVDDDDVVFVEAIGSDVLPTYVIPSDFVDENGDLVGGLLSPESEIPQR